MTSKSLLLIAEHEGPRCCKRNSYLTILLKRMLKEAGVSYNNRIVFMGDTRKVSFFIENITGFFDVKVNRSFERFKNAFSEPEYNEMIKHIEFMMDETRPLIADMNKLWGTFRNNLKG